MCYGMHCPHENSWGECRGGCCECPLPTVAGCFEVDLGVCEEAPSSLVAVWLEDPKWDEELHCFYQRDPLILSEGEDEEIAEDQADRAVVLALWRDETHEEIARWDGPRPAWVRDDPEDE